MKVWLEREGRRGKRAQRLMGIMGLRAIYRSPRTSCPACPGAPRLSLPVGKDQSYPAQPGVGRRHHPLAHGPGAPLLGGHHGLAQPVRGCVAIVQDPRSGSGQGLEASFCVDALKEALGQGQPEVLNTDQGSQSPKAYGHRPTMWGSRQPPTPWPMPSSLGQQADDVPASPLPGRGCRNHPPVQTLGIHLPSLKKPGFKKPLYLPYVHHQPPCGDTASQLGDSDNLPSPSASFTPAWVQDAGAERYEVPYRQPTLRSGQR